MGYALLLQRDRLVGLVLQLPLRTTHIWYFLQSVLIALRSQFLQDLCGLGDMSFAFELGKPFHPFEQLMGVLPSASMDHIPLAYQVCSVALCRALG